MKISGQLLITACWFAAGSPLVSAPPEVLHWRRYEDPAFPPQLLSTPVHDGFATVVFTFDADGKITDRIVLAASHPAFVVAVYEAVLGWEVDPRDLAHFSRRETIRFEFERHHTLITMSQRDAAKAAFTEYGDQQATALRTMREAELHRALTTIATTMPEFPDVAATRGVHGTATVSFVVDAEGRVRVPAVTDATEPEFGEAALAAIRQWRFSPPHQDRLPVQVMVERTFRFGAGSKPP